MYQEGSVAVKCTSYPLQLLLLGVGKTLKYATKDVVPCYHSVTKLMKLKINYKNEKDKKGGVFEHTSHFRLPFLKVIGNFSKPIIVLYCQ